MEDKVVEERSQRAISSRNKENYLKAKAAFNQKDMAGCMSYYAPDHHIRSRDVGPGRQHIERFHSAKLQSLHLKRGTIIGVSDYMTLLRSSVWEVHQVISLRSLTAHVGLE
jgi:hypothetical protein